jgi:hypothetical protein
MSNRKSAAWLAAIALVACAAVVRAEDPKVEVEDAPGSIGKFSVIPLTLDDVKNPAAPAPMAPPVEPDRRGYPAPIDSPPFPNSDWVGPDPIVGERDTTPLYPLEKLLKGTSLGDFLSRNRIRTYGWIDIGGNISTSKKSNAPTSYNLVPNDILLDQAVFRVERYVDSVQTDHMDWGFRTSFLYGTDYRYTAGKGYFDGQLLKHNKLYGADIVEMYGILYIPNVAQGMTIKAGRYISPADIEAQLAPQNYMYTHSMMFTFDPYTYTGVNTVTKLSDQWQVEAGFHFGNDMAPWTNSAQINGLFMLQWKSKDNNDSLYGGVNSIGKGDYKNHHDNLQQVVLTWGHRFNAKYHMQTEMYYMWNYHALQGGTVIEGPPHSFAGSGAGARIKGKAEEWGGVNYFEIKLSDKDYLSIRNDVLDDVDGQRSGFRTLYTTHGIGLSHNFTDTITFRPEIRYEHSWNARAYDNGSRREQFMFAADVVFWF